MALRTLGEAFERLRSRGEPLPDDSSCPVCEYFDITHPDVRRILIDRDPTERLLNMAKCRCVGREDQQRRDDQLRHAQAALPAGGRTFDNFKGRPGTDDMLAAARRFAGRAGPRMLGFVGLSAFVNLDGQSPDQRGDRITPAVGRPPAVPVILCETQDHLGLIDASLVTSLSDGQDGVLVGGHLKTFEGR